MGAFSRRESRRQRDDRGSVGQRRGRQHERVSGLPDLLRAVSSVRRARYAPDLVGEHRVRLDSLPAMTASKTEFHRRLGNALANDRLRTALRRALPELRERRDARMAEVDWEGLRADLTQRKARAIADLPALIERFTAEA